MQPSKRIPPEFIFVMSTLTKIKMRNEVLRNVGINYIVCIEKV